MNYGMRRLAASAFMACLPLTALFSQSFRSMSVWKDGVMSDYSLVTIDSIDFGAGDTTLVIHSGTKTNSFVLNDIDSITVSVPDIVSTNRKSPNELKAEFSKESVKITSYKKFDHHNYYFLVLIYFYQLSHHIKH